MPLGIRAIKNVTPNVEFDLTPPTPDDVKNPDKYIDRELDRVIAVANKATDSLINKASENELLQAQIEKLKAGMRNEHASHERKIIGVVAENAALKEEIAALQKQNSDYLNRMRAIPLLEVMRKLVFPKQVSGSANQFVMPDERFIEISGRSFTDLTGRYGLGQMDKRKSSKGAIDLVMFVTGWDLQLVQKWLKNNFDLGAALIESADKLKDELEPELVKAITADESTKFKNQQKSAFYPDAVQWLEVRKSLTADYGLEPQLLDDLQRASVIDAEVTSLFRATQFVSLGATKGPDHERQTVYDGR